jgi:hypothetical protein
MHSVIAKTFGGLSASCYARHFIFGLAFPVFVLLMLSQTQDSHLLHAPTLLILVVNTLLYPYSRFVYESVMDFIMGQNVIFGSLMLMLGFKLATMLVCWVFAIFIAPFGLAYLYFHHSKTSI